MGFTVTPEMIAQMQAQQQQSSPQAPAPTDSQGAPTSTPGVSGATQAWGAQLPQNIPQVPTPPSATASQLPPPQQVDQQRQGPLKSLLTRFLYGGGQAMLHEVGLPTDFELQKRIQQNLQSSQLQLQNQLVTLPNGVTLPLKVAQTVYPALLREQGTLGAAQIGATSRENVANIGAQSRENVANIQYGPNLPLDPTLAHLAGVDQLAGKLVGKGIFDNISKELSARGIKTVDMGDGTYLVDRSGPIAKIGGSPSVARAFAFGQARAQYTPFETTDAQGNPTTISNMQALQTGAPGITKTNYANVLPPAALIGDIRGALGQVRALTGVLDNAGNRAKIAAVLANPSMTATQFMQSGIAGSLDPQSQDYVMTNLNLRENMMALRSVLKAGQGSEDLRAAIQRTIPGASTPGSDYANRQLDLAGKTLDRLERGLPNVGNVQKIASGGMNNANTPQAYPNAPPIGTVENGYKYVGGNPATATSWKKK